MRMPHYQCQYRSRITNPRNPIELSLRTCEQEYSMFRPDGSSLPLLLLPQRQPLLATKQHSFLLFNSTQIRGYRGNVPQNNEKLTSHHSMVRTRDLGLITTDWKPEHCSRVPASRIVRNKGKCVQARCPPPPRAGGRRVRRAAPTHRRFRAVRSVC